MPQSWKQPLISALEVEIQNYLDEIHATVDPDLWEETAGKLCDVLVVYRRHSAMAFDDAFLTVFGDDDVDDD